MNYASSKDVMSLYRNANYTSFWVMKETVLGKDRDKQLSGIDPKVEVPRVLDHLQGLYNKLYVSKSYCKIQPLI